MERSLEEDVKIPVCVSHKKNQYTNTYPCLKCLSGRKNIVKTSTNCFTKLHLVIINLTKYDKLKKVFLTTFF